MKLNILYEDNQIIVVIKPPNILTQSDITQDQDLLSELKNYIKLKYNKTGNVYLGLVHRLDRPVGGTMVLAKTSKAASRLSLEIREHNFKKIYLAVVHSRKNIKSGKYINYLQKDTLANKSKIVKESEISNTTKKAELELEVLSSVNTFETSLALIKIKLLTGRSHQIRLQLSFLGNPIYADNKYGLNEKGNIALWSSELKFIHPTLKQEMIFKSLPNKEYPWNLFNIV